MVDIKFWFEGISEPVKHIAMDIPAEKYKEVVKLLEDLDEQINEELN